MLIPAFRSQVERTWNDTKTVSHIGSISLQKTPSNSSEKYTFSVFSRLVEVTRV